MISALRRRSRPLVGLDIGSSSVKVIALSPAGEAFSLGAVGREPLPPGAIVDGAVVNQEAVAEAVRTVLTKQGVKTKEVAVSIAGNAVIVKRINLPVMSQDELASSIYWEAKQYIPFDVEDVNLDYQVLGPASGADASGGQDVLLVAAKKDRIAEYGRVVEAVGCVPVVMDVDAFAVQNAYEANYGVEATSTVALLNVGASAVNVNVLQGDRPAFTRDLAIGGNAYTEALQKELGLGFDDAELLKKGVPVDGLTYDDAEPVVRAVSDNLITEVGKTIDFFRATASSDDLTRVVLSGGASRIEGLSEALGDRFDVPVEPLDPFRRIATDDLPLTDEARTELGPVASVAMGLAMRRAHDR